MAITHQHPLNIAYALYRENPHPEVLDSLLAAVTDYAKLVADQCEELRTSDNAADIAQAVSIRVWRNIDKFKGRSSFRTWTYRIVRNAIYDRHRRQKQNVSLEDISEMETPAPTYSEIPTSISADPVCQRLMEGLTPIQIQRELHMSKNKFYEHMAKLKETQDVLRFVGV